MLNTVVYNISCGKYISANGVNTETQKTFNCPKSTTKTLEKVDIGVFIVDFKQVNVCWDVNVVASKVSHSLPNEGIFFL